MTYDQDPARWTSSPEEAPELLRGAFTAARNEGPNPAQMRSLAFKIAAVSAGSAVAVGAAKATAAGNAAATAATWSIGKLVGVLALAGGLAAGAVVWKSSDTKTQPSKPANTSAAAAAAAPSVVEPSALEPADLAAPAPAARTATKTETAPAAAAAIAPSANDVVASGTNSAAPAHALAAPAVRPATQASPVVAERSPVASSSSRRAAASSQRNADTSRGKATITASAGPARTISEVELLRSAQQALRARPREAFQLTEQHRQLYPTGEFAQERDALAIQALLRAGETEMARDLAVSFIKAHPSSPHAHRFREAMGIR